MSIPPASTRRRFVLRLLAALPLGVVVTTLGGCGSGDGQSMMPTDPKDFPENRAKASLDFGRQNATKGKTKRK